MLLILRGRVAARRRVGLRPGSFSHSPIVMTMDVYGHLFPRADDYAELAFAELTLLAL